MSEILKGLEFDPEALLRKYREERDKRLELRPQGNAQYKKMSGDLARFADDPYAKVEPRTPLHRDIEVAVLGGGFGALLTGTRLRQAGIDDAWLIEQGGDFGGTWYWNRYPGAACDTEAYVYFPLLEEVGAIPSHKYAKAPEILAHAQAIGRKFGLYEKALFHTQVEAIEWDEAAERWLVKTNRGDRIRARYFVMASGALQIPKLPGIPGIEAFKGHSFHTSRWDYAYTGGTSLGDLTNLTDKRVGIIGTGATAVQAVPHLG
ncbi:MAG: flavin-containing monooxygenase, partial [Caulobacterales bacterium]